MEGSQLNARRIGSELARISDKVFSGERLSFEEGGTLYRTSDLHAVGDLANRVREKWNGNTGYFNVNRHLNPTNVCVVDCKFCGFARKPARVDTPCRWRRPIITPRWGIASP